MGDAFRGAGEGVGGTCGVEGGEIGGCCLF